jgi:hypothetical protein
MMMMKQFVIDYNYKKFQQYQKNNCANFHEDKWNIERDIVQNVFIPYMVNAISFIRFDFFFLVS